MATIPAIQSITVADYDLDLFNNKLNAALLKISAEMVDLDDIRPVVLSCSFQTTFPESRNPITKPYYVAVIPYLASVDIA